MGDSERAQEMVGGDTIGGKNPGELKPDVEVRPDLKGGGGGGGLGIRLAEQGGETGGGPGGVVQEGAEEG